MMVRGGLVGLSTVVLLGWVGVSPAEAAASGSLGTPGSGVIYDDCRNEVQVPYSLNLPADTDDWDVVVSTTAPDGTSGPVANLHDGLGDPTSGTVGLEFCGGEMPGAYTLTGSGQYDEYDSTTDHYTNNEPITFPTTTFTMRLPRTTTSIAKSVVRGKPRLKVSVEDERPAGYFPTDDAYVILQERGSDGTWHKVPGTKHLTNAKGRYTYTINRIGTAAKVRIETQSSGHYTGSTSKPVTLRQ